MTSRWMLGVQGRQRSYRKRLGNISITVRERKFWRRKILIGKNGYVIKIESIDEHLERMLSEAKNERNAPKEPTRVLSRILEIESIRELELNSDEQKIIRSYLYKPVRRDGNPTGEILLRPDVTISMVETAILRYRRLTNRTIETEQKKKDEYKKEKKKRQTKQTKTFTFKE